jgi:hypothetical protein
VYTFRYVGGHVCRHICRYVRMYVCWYVGNIYRYLCVYSKYVCMYEMESKSNLNISIKRQWLELERCLFLSFYQGSHHSSECACSSTHTSPKMGLANSSLAIECRTPTQLFLKLSWDSKRPASSYFTLGKRKKFIGVLSSK